MASLLELLITVNLGLVILLGAVLARSQQLKQWLQQRLHLQPARLAPAPDPLPTEAWWQDEVRFQAQLTRGQILEAAIFGDSITAALGQTLGAERFNYALSGMTTTSLRVQVQQVEAQIQRAAIALGTNDADRLITPEAYGANLETAIARLRQLGCDRIDLLPPHFPTPGHLWNYGYPDALKRIRLLKQHLGAIADGETIFYHPDFFASLYNGDSLKPELTTDGVHLNAVGKLQYRDLLLALWQ